VLIFLMQTTFKGYTRSFFFEKIDGQLLLSLSESDLQYVFQMKLGERKEFMSLIASLKESKTPSLVSTTPAVTPAYSLAPASAPTQRKMAPPASAPTPALEDRKEKEENEMKEKEEMERKEKKRKGTNKAPVKKKRSGKRRRGRKKKKLKKHHWALKESGLLMKD